METTYVKNKEFSDNKKTSRASILDFSSQNNSLQRKVDMMNNAVQHAEVPRPNNTGMPNNLKSGIESLSGFSMDDVRVHYNSSKPATVQALAYTQGTDIHVAPGQEKHLPHEAWHVAQQMAGRVSPTTNINGMPVNDNAALEHEADMMGEKAVTQNKSFEAPFHNLQKGPLQRQKILQKQCFLGKRNLLLGFSSSKSAGSSQTSRYGGSSQTSANASTPSLLTTTSPSTLPSIGLDSTSRSTGTGSKESISEKNLKQPDKTIDIDKVNGQHPYTDSETIGHTGNYGLGDIGFFHAHFWFNQNYYLPYTEGSSTGNNIGYGGILYSDDTGVSNYDLIGPISENNNENKVQPQDELTDIDIVNAMHKLPWQGGYNALTHNCQHWANSVINQAETEKKERVKQERLEEFINDSTLTDDKEKNLQAHAYLLRYGFL